MAKVTLELDWDQTEKIVMDALQESLRLEFRMGEDQTLIDAYKLVLRDFMLAPDYNKFIQELEHRESMYNSKRLTDANGGL